MNTTSPSQKKIINNVLWTFIRVWGNRFGGIIIFFILARLLTPFEFGVYSAIWAIILFLEVFTEQGLGDAIIQTKEISRPQLNTVFLINFGMSLFITLMVVLNAPQLAALANMPEIEKPLQVSTLAIIFNAIGFSQVALYRRNFEYKWLAIRTLVATLLSGLVGVLMAMNGFGAWSLVVQFVLAAFINMMLLWVRPLWIPSFEFTLSGVKPLIHFSSKLLGSKFLDVCSTRLFEFAIGGWMGAVALGIYSIGSRIYYIVIQLLSNVGLDVAHSGFSRIADDQEKVLKTYYQSMMLTLMISLPVFTILSSVSNEFVITVFGERWTESGRILQVLALLGAVQCVQQLNLSVVNALGHSGTQLKISAIKAVAILIAFMVFGYNNQTSNLYHLVIAYTLVQLPLLPLSLIMAKKYIHFSWKLLLDKTYVIMFAALFAYYVMNISHDLFKIDHSVLSLLVLSMIGSIVYTGTLLINPNYVKLLKKLINKRSF